MPRLELTWIGKDQQPRLEPRILLENPDLRCGTPGLPAPFGELQGQGWQGMLIHGDNLLALKALEAEYAGQVKCIYIDPPFNTGARIDADGKEIGYDDGLEHSIWLSMMTMRLKVLYQLLSKDGSLFIHLDDNEVDYCKVVLDEIFGRNSFVNRMTLDARSPSAFSTVNPGVFKSSEYILWYTKDKNFFTNRSLRIETQRDSAYNKYLANKLEPIESWRFIPLKIAFLEYWNKERMPLIDEFINTLFSNCKGFSKNDLKTYIVKKFPLHVITNLERLTNYMYQKLKSSDTFEVFVQSVYQYVLEKCSIFYTPDDMDQFVFNNADSVCRETEISDSGAGKEIVEMKYKSLKNRDFVHVVIRENGLDDVYIINGKQIAFYSKNVHEINGTLTSTKLLTNIWVDISWEGIANEGSVKFKKGKKPEKLIQRCLQLATNPGDLVLDSFLGSGTTAAVAHKMGRRWIGIELGEHAHTHCAPRLRKVVRGEDPGGISKAVNWQGGGGFRFYSLAPTLLRQDQYGQWVINPEYNAPMLAAAVAKHEGFRYAPDAEVWWKQARSAEKDYLLVTTQYVNRPLLDAIRADMAEGETLLVCCKAFDAPCARLYPEISVKKIPNMLVDRCEFGRDDYSLHIVNLPNEPNPPFEEPDLPPDTETADDPEEQTRQGKLFE